MQPERPMEKEIKYIEDESKLVVKLQELSARLNSEDYPDTFRSIEANARKATIAIREESIVPSETMKEKFYFKCLTT